MISPKYCTSYDRRNEIQAMERVVKHMNRVKPSGKWTFKQCSDTSSWDGELMLNGKLYALLEVRGRNGDRHRFAEWHTRKSKVDKITDTAKRLGVHFFLIVTWDGEPFVAVPTIWGQFPKTHISGRTDRNDPNDWEELYLIPSSDFTQIP